MGHSGQSHRGRGPDADRESAGPVEGSWLAEPLANLRSRLSATLTPTGRRYCAELRKANVATVFGSGHYGEKRAELEAIHEAIEKQHRVRIDYATPGKPTAAARIGAARLPWTQVAR